MGLARPAAVNKILLTYLLCKIFEMNNWVHENGTSNSMCRDINHIIYTYFVFQIFEYLLHTCRWTLLWAEAA